MHGLGQRIRAARKAAGLTQQALAGEDFTVGFISQLENGLVRPSLRSLEVLARRLGRPLSYFLDEPAPAAGTASLDLAEKLLEAGRTAEAGQVLAPWQAAAAAGPLGARARRLLGVWLLQAGAPAEALSHLQAALPAAGEDDPEERVRIHNAIASALDRLQRWEEAESHLTQAMALINSGADADPVLRMKVETNLAILYCRLGRYEACSELGERLLQWARQTGLTFRLGELLLTLGVARHRCGDPEAALAYYRMARQLFSLLGDDRLRAGALRNEGMALQDLGWPEEARTAPDESVRMG